MTWNMPETAPRNGDLFLAIILEGNRYEPAICLYMSKKNNRNLKKEGFYNFHHYKGQSQFMVEIYRWLPIQELLDELE